MIVALVGLKGGVGKTTLAAAIAGHAHLHGRRSLLIDLDPHGSLRHWCDAGLERGRSMPPTLSLGRTPLDQIELARLGEGFDMTIIDCPTGSEAANALALAEADVALLPCPPRVLDVWGLGAVLQEVVRVTESRPELVVAIVANQVDARHPAQLAWSADMPAFDPHVLTSVVHRRAVFADAMITGGSPATVEPRGAAAAEVAQLFAELATLGIRSPRQADARVH